MRKKLPKILVTGGAGFIGSAFVRQAVRRGYRTVVVDKLTYAGDLGRLKGLEGKYKFYKEDVCNYAAIEAILKKEKPQSLLHFAAETHVDRSIQQAEPFIRTNIIGTQVLLDVARRYRVKKFIHISSDEVYGEIKKGEFLENHPLNPSSPYSASKAAADLLIRTYIRTYNFPAIIVRPSNNYGPWQYPEKLIPLAILKILRDERVPVYGKGRNIREWLYIEDCAEGILRILEKGKIGEVYNLGSRAEKQNIEVVKEILMILGRGQEMIEFVKDRPGHDIRYRLNSRKLFKETGWKPRMEFSKGIRLTVQWYLKHKGWLLSKWRNIAPLYK